MRNVTRCVLGVGLGLFLSAADASAHGGAPRAFEVLTAPGNPDDVVLRSDLWGLFRTRDGGKTWNWTCAEGYGGDSLSVDHLNMALTKTGRFFVAETSLGLRYTDDGCSWADVAEFHGEYPVDVHATLDRVVVLTSHNTNGDAGIVGGLYESTDGGDHFTVLSAPTPTDFSNQAFAFAPSDPTRVYVTGRHLNTTPAALLHSTDGSKTWSETAVGLTDVFMRLRIAGVDPTRPDVVFLWGDLEETGVGIDSPDQLWATGDGGKTVQQIYVANGDLPGFAFSPDGADVYLGGPTIGLLRAKVDDLLTTGGTAFTDALSTTVRSTPNDRRVFGLRYDATGLVAGLDNFTRAGVPAIYFGTYDQSTSDFTSLMTICDANYDSCAKGTSVGDVCPGIFSEPLGGFKHDFITNSGRCATSTDAGFHLTFGDGAAHPVTPSSRAKSSGCSVSTRRSPVEPGLSALALLGLGACLRRRRKRTP